MTRRRMIVGLVLTLFACTAISVIVSLPGSARSGLAERLQRSSTAPSPPTETPSTSPAGAGTPSAVGAGAPTPSAVETGSRSEVSAGAQTPSPVGTGTLPATAKPVDTAPPPVSSPPTTPSAKPKPPPPAKKAQPKPAPTAKPKSTTPPKAPKTSKKKQAKRAAARYLVGPLRPGPGGTVYLTFDDGPSPYTAAILATLARTHSTATFFHLGANELGYLGSDARIRAQGSKVANHSYNHPDLTKLTSAQLAWQLRNGPTAKCFRPPYGATNSKVRSAIRKAGMREVLWTIDTLDWTKPGTATLAKTGRLKAVRAGSIILMHDGGGDRRQTVDALPTIINDLHARGFQLRALPYC